MVELFLDLCLTAAPSCKLWLSCTSILSIHVDKVDKSQQLTFFMRISNRLQDFTPSKLYIFSKSEEKYWLFLRHLKERDYKIITKCHREQNVGFSHLNPKIVGLSPSLKPTICNDDGALAF